MSCSKNETDLDITIPVVMILKSGGDILNKAVEARNRGNCFIFWLSATLGMFLPEKGRLVV